MKKAGFTIVFVFAAVCAFSQSRYLPLGVNGSSFGISSSFRAFGLESFSAEAGYSLGGRMDLSLTGGFVVEDVEGVQTIVPNAFLNYDLVLVKQTETVPVSVMVGAGIGFAAANTGGRSLSGLDYGFDMTVSYDVPIRKVFLGVNGVCEYRFTEYDVTNPAVTLSRHLILIGPGIDVGLSFSGDNLVVLRTDLLWDWDGNFHARLNAVLVLPKKY